MPRTSVLVVLGDPARHSATGWHPQSRFGVMNHFLRFARLQPCPERTGCVIMLFRWVLIPTKSGV